MSSLLIYTGWIDPATDAQILSLVDYTNSADIDAGNLCYSVPDATDVLAGQNATLQLTYVSTTDSGINATYYTCADIQFVELSSWATDSSLSCCNTTEGVSATSSASGVTPTAATTTSPDSSSSKSTGSSETLSGGAISGIVVGVCAVVSSAVALLILKCWCRRETRFIRQSAEMRMDALKRMSDVSKSRPSTATAAA